MDAASAAALPRDLAFVDLETTGANAAHHRITEIGVVRVENGVLVEEWSSLVNPECRIPHAIQSFTGITNEMVEHAPRFRDIAVSVREKLAGAVFVAHNARFDYSFLRGEFRRLGSRFSAKVLCTVKLSRRLFPEHTHHNLDAVMERHGLHCAARHRALGDARVLWDLWEKLSAEVPPCRFAATLQSLFDAVRLPAQLPADLADDLPDGAGVYRFFGEDDALLYVGKSVSLRTRILAHFAVDHADSKEHKLARQVRRVDWLETAGELGALLRESAWVKTQHPLHNRRLKRNTGTVTMCLPEHADGRVRFAPIETVPPAQLPQSFGLFRTPKDAQRALTDIARNHRLCLKVLGVEDGPGSCVAHQIGKCRGACAGGESAAIHHLRAQLALASLKLKVWPFPGRIGLRERNPGGGADLHVLDPWAYLGTACNDEELAALLTEERTYPFDADVYRILVRHFAHAPQLDWLDLRVAIGAG
jgi:DNA polymerase-3 subunit epsilon